jgi:hypothetical protein
MMFNGHWMPWDAMWDIMSGALETGKIEVFDQISTTVNN